ncbi:angiopoietin-related protein 2-like isoform X2 [Physella acuta]|uniref:angiopoietin-related protein 2-like isoform X2 n=1 Tax=Physella acuta TaxID=109671 RepID=UPI0027DE3736|nr:angiopoietin-related protein 2-like isoform X2 [Physella acuta]
MVAVIFAAVLVANICIYPGDFALYEYEYDVSRPILDLKTCEKGAMFEEFSEREIMTTATGKDILCDTKTDGGGWILMLRRCVGDVNFARPWSDYRDGFGTLDGDFWQGLEQVHQLTRNGKWELRVDMKFGGKNYYANYKSFKLDSEAQFYTLHVGQFSGNVGDDLHYHNGMKFYTTDRPTTTYCTKDYSGGWWYNLCYRTYLTGEWGSKEWAKGIHWDQLSTGNKNLDSAEMKFRKI